MQVEITIKEQQKELLVQILTNQMSEEVIELKRQIEALEGEAIAGYQDSVCELLKPSGIISFYAENKKVYARTETGSYLVKQRLYELEELLEGKEYIRISNSELINKKWIRRFDLRISGTIALTCKDGSQTFVSRRYVKEVRKKIGI